MEEKKLLEVENLSVHFATDIAMVQAVREVSFVLNRGETLGIVGESGSGKSVTALTCMRLLSPEGHISGGKVKFTPTGGRKTVDLLPLPETQMQQYRGNRMAMVFQEPMTSLNPVYRCGEQIVEAIRQHHPSDYQQARQQTLDLLTKVKLRDPERIFQSFPHQLSGGQKQRVMIAMALSCNPDLLIADEPTTALDVTVQKAILALLKDLKKEFQLSVLFISHDLGVIAEIADRVMVMREGKVVETGSVRQIFEHPTHPYTQGLLACRPPLNYRVKRLPTVADFMENEHEGHSQENFDSFLEKARISPQVVEQRLGDLMSQPPVLSVRGLKTWFPRSSANNGGRFVKAVDEVTFDVYPGETLGLVGESGCGKTTLGRSILMLEPPSEGKVLFHGEDITHPTRQQRKRLSPQMQIVFQDPYSSLNPRMMIGEAIQEPLLVHGLCANNRDARDRVMDLLKMVNLEPRHYFRYPHEFSGGQRQRICIARALAVNPSFLICDESVSALDVSVQAQILNLLMELREQFQFTSIFISHDLSVVKLMSDRMMVMQEGKIVELGPADEVYQHPRSPYTQQLIDAIPKGI